jgi:hypothetical protein
MSNNKIQVIKMKTKKIFVFGFFISLFLFINLASALPCAFFGEVALDGSPTNGTYVEAYYLNGTFISKGKEPTAGFGHYSIAVNAPGENITLKIKGIPVDQGNQFCENGEPNYLNISATTPLTTSTTPPTTTTIPSGNGGNGGRNSGGFVTTTIVPVTTTISTPGKEETAMEGEEVNVETTIPTQTETTTVPQKIGITGAFLTTVASLGYWWILIIIIIVLAIVALIVDKKYRETKDTNSGNDTNPEQNMNPSNEQSSQNEEPKQEPLQDPGN